MKAYPIYKDSGVPWLGDVPEHWAVRRTKYILKETDRRSNYGTEQLLSVSQYTGVTPRKKKDNSDIVDSRASSLVGYKVVQKNDLVINIMLAWNGSLGVSPFSGIVSPAYCIYRFSSEVLPKYYHYLYKTDLYKTTFKTYSTGVVESRLRLYSDKLGRIESLLPSLDEQQQISRYLDWQTSKINKFIKAKKKLIALLKEQKQNIINEAVTKGINPDVEMKNSGVEWLGKIPKHWDVRKLKHIAAMKSGDNLTSMEIEEQGQYPVYGGNGLRGYYHAYNRSGSFLLVGRQGALCGNVHRVRGDFWATEHAVVTKLKQGICLDWYYYMLIFMNLNQYSEAAAQPGISVEKIQNLRTTVPPQSEQEQIANFIDTETALIDKTIARTEREIELIQEYRTRLVSDVVTGKVDVRSVDIPDFEPAPAELEAQDEEESDLSAEQAGDELITEGIEE